VYRGKVLAKKGSSRRARKGPSAQPDGASAGLSGEGHPQTDIARGEWEDRFRGLLEERERNVDGTFAQEESTKNGRGNKE